MQFRQQDAISATLLLQTFKLLLCDLLLAFVVAIKNCNPFITLIAFKDGVMCTSAMKRRGCVARVNNKRSRIRNESFLVVVLIDGTNVIH